MEELRLQAVAARVAAWHNQHPFAHRITPQHVHSVGYVVLPYVVADGASTDAAPTRRWQAAFVENFIAPMTPARVARWARRHGRVLAALPSDAPLRVIATAPTEGTAHYRQVVVLSAAIDVGTLSTRVLMGAGTPGAVIGPRLWHGYRLAAGASAAAALMLVLSWLAVAPRAAPTASGVMAAASAASAASTRTARASIAAASGPTPALSPAPATVMALAAAPASAPSPSPSPSPAASSAAPAASAVVSVPASLAVPVTVAMPVDVQPQSGRVALPALAGLISEEAKAQARAHRQTLPVVQAAASAPAAVADMPTGPAGAAPTSPAGAAPTGPRFALATRLLRTRAEAEQFQVAMSALLRGGSAGLQGKVQTDILPEGEDWRVVGMPFTQRGEAEKTRRLLMVRGMRVDVVNF
jgi:hypothetical protein